MLLIATVSLFPFLFLTLELPKRIINDAIGAGGDSVFVFGFEFTQIGFLALLCVLFLLSVVIHGLLKMRINTMKGVVAERMLRRLRYQLVTRLFRFPKPYFQRTSQSEIVSMVTSEAEPLGGMMGNAISQPIMQLGQMLTILAFLFLQSFWFGLAAVSMIPLQAWLIPRLQKQINILNKRRIKEVRKLASEIGETAVGSTALRANGGYRYRAAQLTHQLGKLFFIRLAIYKKKFFMKFLNNFLSQLTPFFFFSIGGYLVIVGNVTIGALIAALAAYKDLSSPWKELLTYYTRAHEMAQRWTLLTDHFAPSGALDRTLIESHPNTIDRLQGDVSFDGVTAHDSDGVAVIKNLTVTFPKGGLIGIAAPNDEDRRAMAELLTRELLPSSGTISIGGSKLSEIHQDIIGARIGWADSNPYLFAGTIRDNILMALRANPQAKGPDVGELVLSRLEAEKSGNSVNLVEDRWLTPSIAELDDLIEVYKWWITIIEAIGVDRDILRRSMGLKTTPEENPKLTTAIVDLRGEIKDVLGSQGFTNTVTHFDRTAYNSDVPILRNILFASLKKSVSQRQLADHPDFLELLRKTDLLEDVFAVAQSLVDLLFTTFGSDGTDHPLFQRISIDAQSYAQTVKISKAANLHGIGKLPHSDLALLLALPCLIEPAHVGEFVPTELTEKIVSLRVKSPELLAGSLGDVFQTLDQNEFSAGLSFFENAIFGVVDKNAAHRSIELQDVVIDTLVKHGYKSYLAGSTLIEETTFGGTNLPRKMLENIGFVRAAIKRPDIFILDKVLAGYDDSTRFQASIRLRQEMPNATIIYLEEGFRHPENFDVYMELNHGDYKLGTGVSSLEEIKDETETDLVIKLQALEQTEFFADLDRKQMRLLAFSARWFEKTAGDVVFTKGEDPSDGAYLILDGEADFYLPVPDKEDQHIRTLGPGAMVGELALILDEPRSLSMKARTNISGLRIGGEEFLVVLQNDPQTAFNMLQVVTRYLTKKTS